MKFMKFRQPGEYGGDIWINMDQVTHITPQKMYNGTEGSVIYFNLVEENTRSYLLVNEIPSTIIARLP